MPRAYQPSGECLFFTENIRNCEKAVLTIRRRMDKAVADNDKDSIRIEYWKKREYENAYHHIHSIKVRKLYERQKGKCLHCKKTLTLQEIQDGETHIHHMKPVSLGGDNGYSNLRLIHTQCHRELHAKYSREEMSNLTDKRIDYIIEKI